MADRRQLCLFFATVAIIACGQSMFDSTFSNFLADTFGISAHTRGWLELPRELPGFLVVLTAGLLCALPVPRVGRIAASAMALGFAGLGLFGRNFVAMIAMMLVASAGVHLLMPVTSTLALTMAGETQRGRRMGQVGLMETCGLILGNGFIWLFFKHAKSGYRTGFFIGAALAALAAVIYSAMRLPHLHQARTPLVVRREYGLYYVLEFFAGARKQIFLTFGPWVLIKVYGAQASSIAGLLLIAAAIGLFFKPTAGLLIDRFGERKIMLADNLTLIVVCLGYGYALRLTGGRLDHARWLACGCFVADNLLFTLGNARAIYLSRIARSSQDLTSTLAMGVSVNHIVSMTIPIAAGRLWDWLGYESLFTAASGLALVIAVIALAVPKKKIPAPPPPAEREASVVAGVGRV